MPVEQQPPDVLAMLIAETVLLDVVTDKKSIQGVYDTIQANEFPWAQRLLVVYVVLTEGYGDTLLKLRLVDVDELEPPLFEQEATISFAEPLDVLDVVFAQNQVVFPEPGEYRLQLFGAGQPLQERRIRVLDVEESTES